MGYIKAGEFKKLQADTGEVELGEEHHLIKRRCITKMASGKNMRQKTRR
ncbi:MAG: hypothetical protein WC649_08270 [Desulfobacteria bacterium]